MNAGVIIFVLLLVLAFLGLPIYLSIGIATMVAMLHAGFPLEAVAQKTFLGMNSSSLLCIPLFILAGNIMAQGITQKLINAANVPLGRVRGSLASVTVLSSALFGAISGSAVATVAAVGGMTVPAMVKEGYDKNYAVACASCSGIEREADAANSPLPLQKMHPRVPIVPSRFGQVQPAESASL